MTTDTKQTQIAHLFQRDWAGFHDAVVEALDVAPSVEQAAKLFIQLPDRIQEKALKWGLNDSEVRDECFEAISDLGLTITSEH